MGFAAGVSMGVCGGCMLWHPAACSVQKPKARLAPKQALISKAGVAGYICSVVIRQHCHWLHLFSEVWFRLVASDYNEQARAVVFFL